MKFAIRVEEVIGRTIIVEADDLEEAVENVEEACNNDDIFLDGIEDFVERNVFPSDNFKNGIVEDSEDVSFYEHLKM